MTLLLPLLAVCVSVNLSTKKLRENMGQHNSEGKGFKRDQREHETLQDIKHLNRFII
jgi:hypothetical protein